MLLNWIKSKISLLVSKEPRHGGATAMANIGPAGSWFVLVGTCCTKLWHLAVKWCIAVFLSFLRCKPAYCWVKWVNILGQCAQAESAAGGNRSASGTIYHEWCATMHSDVRLWQKSTLVSQRSSCWFCSASQWRGLGPSCSWTQLREHDHRVPPPEWRAGI